MSKRKTVIITGALGFIGSHTAKLFKSLGYHVIGIDRAATIPVASQFLDQMFLDDFVDMAAVAAVVNDAQAIVHCAGSSLVGPSISDPTEYYNNNSAKTNKMMHDLAKRKWHGTVVFSSSAATYGIPAENRDIYETDPQNPISPYGWSKLFCEKIIKDHCYAHDMKGIALRYFNACGCDPDGKLGHVEDDTHIIPSILRAYHNHQTFKLNGNDYDTPDGTCIRDYLHVSDIAWAHLVAVEKANEFDQGQFRAYNLGTGRGYSNREIIDACQQAVNDEIGVIIGPRRIGDPDKLVANSDLFRQTTSWLPIHSDLDTIVRTSWAWQKNHPIKI